MTTKKTAAYIGMIVLVLIGLKMYADRVKQLHEGEFEQEEEQAALPTPEFPVDYSLGDFDDRFGISQEKFMEIADQAKKVWEDAAGKPLFERRDEGTLKINLVFDWRQERLLEARNAKAGLDETGRSFDQLQAEYNDRAKALDQYRAFYNDAAATYTIHLEEYNASVRQWNQGSQQSEGEYRALQSAKRRIDDEQNSLNKTLSELNSRGRGFNEYGEKLSELAKKHNLDVEKFNGRFVQSRDFEKGVFNGKSINIYEFEKEEDLRLTLVHEFGHAIGLGHADNPKAIMFRKLAVQEMAQIRLTEEDVKLLRSRVR
jgi:predicted Zn-dependent protease